MAYTSVGLHEFVLLTSYFTTTSRVAKTCALVLLLFAFVPCEHLSDLLHF